MIRENLNYILQHFDVIENDTIVGSFKTQNTAGTYSAIFLLAFVIQEEFRNKGYGYKALIDAINLFKEQKYNAIKLRVEKTNKRAIYLYLKVGFFITKEETEHTIVMQFNL